MRVGTGGVEKEEVALEKHGRDGRLGEGGGGHVMGEKRGEKKEMKEKKRASSIH